MCVVARSLKHPVVLALSSFVLGAGAALVGVWALGTPWKSESVVEVEKIVEKVVEKPVPAPVDASRVDLVVMQKGKPQGLDSNVSEYFVDVTRGLPGVERVSEAVVGTANMLRDNGAVDDTIVLVQGWKPDNVGYEALSVLKGRQLQPGDSHKVMLGRILAENLNKKVGDKLTFVGAPNHPYEVVGVFNSRVVFEEGGAIIPFQDGQALHGLKGKVTGFTVRIKKLSPDSAAEVDAVKQKIEALRDPDDPTVRLTAEPTERR